MRIYTLFTESQLQFVLGHLYAGLEFITILTLYFLPIRFILLLVV